MLASFEALPRRRSGAGGRGPTSSREADRKRGRSSDRWLILGRYNAQVQPASRRAEGVDDMRIFGINDDGSFREFVTTPFQLDHEEAVLETWLESNPSGIVEDGPLLVIGRQVTTNMGGSIDLLALDRAGDVVVLELKRDRTPRETVAQALEYAAFAQGLSTDQLQCLLATYVNDESVSIAEYHRQYFEISSDEAVSFNNDQRLVIVGQRVTPEIRQTARFLSRKGIRVTCVEFSFFRAEGGTRLLSQDIVVGGESSRPSRVASASLPVTTEAGFLGSLDGNGGPLFERLLAFAHQHGHPVHWGNRGFSLNVNLDGNHVAVCFGYPPHSVFRQSVYTTLYRSGGIVSRFPEARPVADSLFGEAQRTGLFQPAGRELKCPVDHPFDDQQVEVILAWVAGAVEQVKRCAEEQ